MTVAVAMYRVHPLKCIAMLLPLYVCLFSFAVFAENMWNCQERFQCHDFTKRPILNCMISYVYCACVFLYHLLPQIYLGVTLSQPPPFPTPDRGFRIATTGKWIATPWNNRIGSVHVPYNGSFEHRLRKSIVQCDASPVINEFINPMNTIVFCVS